MCARMYICDSPCGIYRAMVKRHDMLEKKVERAEITLSAKAEAKATIQREVQCSFGSSFSANSSILRYCNCHAYSGHNTVIVHHCVT